MHIRWAALMACLVVGGSGCALPERDADPEATQSPATASTSEPALPCVPGAEPFTGPAAETFGAERVMEAYCMLAGLAEEQGRTSLALLVPEQEARDVDALREVLTPDPGRPWKDWTRQRTIAARSTSSSPCTHGAPTRPPSHG